MPNEMATTGFNALMQEDSMNRIQHAAKLISGSDFFPEHLRGKKADTPEIKARKGIANAVVGLVLASEMGVNPLTLLQNLYVVSGRPGFSTQFLIARANQIGPFKGTINWRVSKGEPKSFTYKEKVGWDRGPVYKERQREAPQMEVTAYATMRETGDEVSFSVSMDMAAAEGWLSNEKYFSMGELMLRYRSAATLIRLYAPEVMFGMGGLQTVEELESYQVVDDRPAPMAPRKSIGEVLDSLPEVDLPQLEEQTEVIELPTADKQPEAVPVQADEDGGGAPM